MDCLDQVIELFLGDEIVEVDSHPTRLDQFAASENLGLESRAGTGVDAEKTVPVRSGAGTASPGLDSEQVVEQGNHEVVMKEAVGPQVFGTGHQEGDDGKTVSIPVAEDPDPRIL